MGGRGNNMVAKSKQKERTDQTKKDFLKALEKSRGIIVTACKAVGMSRSQVRTWRAQDKVFRDAMDEISENSIDFVEGKLYDKIAEGDLTAIIFYLKTKGRERGYGAKSVAEIEEKRAKAEERTALGTIQKDIEKKIRSKKQYIVKLLKEQGKYTSELTYQVEITAKLLVRADILSNEIFSSGYEPINVEYSREGAERKAIDPREKLFMDVLLQGQRALRALGMNTESKERRVDKDNYSDFMNECKFDDTMLISPPGAVEDK